MLTETQITDSAERDFLRSWNGDHWAFQRLAKSYGRDVVKMINAYDGCLDDAVSLQARIAFRFARLFLEARDEARS